MDDLLVLDPVGRSFFFTNFHHIGSLHNLPLALNLLRVWQYFSKDKSTKLYMGG